MPGGSDIHWYIGVGLGIGSSIVSNVGVNVQKLAHSHRASKDPSLSETSEAAQTDPETSASPPQISNPSDPRTQTAVHIEMSAAPSQSQQSAAPAPVIQPEPVQPKPKTPPRNSSPPTSIHRSPSLAAQVSNQRRSSETI